MIVIPEIAISAGGGELSVGGESSAVNCESQMQKYLIFKIGQGDFDENEEMLKRDFFDKCEELSDRAPSKEIEVKRGSEGTAADTEVQRVEKASGQVTIKKDMIDGRLREKGFIVEGDHVVVAFATERIEKDLISSFFSSIPSGDVTKNECETALYDIFLKKGFSSDTRRFNRTQKMRARAFRTVVNRYKDLSYMPNDSTIKAAAIVDKAAEAVVTCGVVVDIDDSDRGFEACAKGRCKTVDVATRGRIATATNSKCESNENKTTAYIGAIRHVCDAMGRSLGSDMVRMYSSK